MKDLEDILCKLICTRNPVYEAEIECLLKSLLKRPRRLSDTRPDLLKFLCERMVLFGDGLAKNEGVMSLLRPKASAKDRLLAIVSLLDEDASIEEALIQELGSKLKINQLGQDTALLQTVVRTLTPNAAPTQLNQPALSLQPVQPVPLSQAAPSDDVVARTSNKSSSTLVQNSLPGSATHSTTPQGHKRPRSPAPSATLTRLATDTKPRRPYSMGDIYEPSEDDFSFEFILIHIRPSVEGEEWSITSGIWEDLNSTELDAYTHAGHICETEAGMVAHELCSHCAEYGFVCEVYTDEVKAAMSGLGYASSSLDCAMCRIFGEDCSHNSKKPRTEEGEESE